ncbi:MAG: molybdopterin molybdotransferase MoeA [Planctomycetales bacterium]|nr:molybdopterin molybdotransferase MoeA [Planctomycetales bacterium]MBN8628425.1 molybdopterin molybdotransferase MoeA [Planctomycetota bacterium]
MLTVAEALQKVQDCVAALPPRVVPLEQALGCLTAESIASDVDSPPYDKSMVDGYAIRYADLKDGVGELRFLEEVTAGELPTVEVVSGTTTRIMTGAPMPAGADAVVMVERSKELPTGHIRLEDPKAKPGQNIVRRAAVMSRGDAVLPAGKLVTPTVVGLLAEVGCAEVRVVPRPRVAVLATGNELVEPREKPAPGQIRNSNGPMLAAQVMRSGAEPIVLGIARDDRESLRTKIAAGLETDLLVLSGGVSAGVLDLVPSVLTELGVREVFHKISMKPGKPLWFGLRKGADGRMTPVFGLPGNPVSSLVCFELFVRPAIAQLAGQPLPAEPQYLAKLTEPFTHRGDRPTFWPGRREQQTAGSIGPSVQPLRWQGSGDLRTLIDADCLICFPAGDRAYVAGEKVDVRPFC